ncbi:hypothetical protein HYN59_05140 [Flavobacterium album]|uniref:Uncharacterized protein n=1 Tax=Flavobacterium album TaxID=2175091 RepID=A0A2S1QW27_9FLAO|nr:hypothetical protein HYN59_05140 [Flavobacterium album]
MRYTCKIWATTVAISPLIILILIPNFFNGNDWVLYAITMYLFIVMFGAVLSLPAIAIFYYLNIYLKKYLSGVARKIILSIYTFLSVYFTFVLSEFDIIPWWFAIYSFIMTGSLWLYDRQLKPVSE